MPDINNKNSKYSVFDVIDHPIIANTNSVTLTTC